MGSRARRISLSINTTNTASGSSNGNARYLALPNREEDDLETGCTPVDLSASPNLYAAASERSYPPSPSRKARRSSFPYRKQSKSPLYSPSLDPTSFETPWGSSKDGFRALFLFTGSRMRVVVLLSGALLGLVMVMIVGAVLDIPVLGFARGWALQSPSRVYDREEDFRWKASSVAPPKADGAEIPFLLDRFGYSGIHNLSEPVPSILHVVPPGKGVFSYIQWLSITSGIVQLKPARTMAHMIRGTVPEPGTNFWFDEVSRLPGFEVRQVPDVTEIFGNPINDVSHKADIIRMKALLEWGGIYIDTDVLVLKSFKELIDGGREEMVMGVERAHNSFVEPVDIEGLCNAVMVVKKGSRFLMRWWEEYKHFNGLSWQARSMWNYHSVQLPWLLAKNATNEKTPITVLDHRSFFTPLWDKPAMKWVHGTLRLPGEVDPAPVLPDDSSASSSLSEPPSPPEPPTSRFRFALADLDTPLSTDFAEEDLTNPSNPKAVSKDQRIAELEISQHGMRAPDQAGWAFHRTEQFAYHMWHHLLVEQIEDVTDGDVKSEDDLGVEDTLGRESSFNRVARKYLTKPLLERYERWNAKHQNSPTAQKVMAMMP